MKNKSNADAYVEAKQEHRDALVKLRSLILKHPFEETIKWGMPTYVYKNRNLVGIGAFKHQVGVWFFQGALLKGHNKILRNDRDQDEQNCKDPSHDSPGHGIERQIQTMKHRSIL